MTNYERKLHSFSSKISCENRKWTTIDESRWHAHSDTCSFIGLSSSPNLDAHAMVIQILSHLWVNMDDTLPNGGKSN
jgi:hypothetical protein